MVSIADQLKINPQEICLQIEKFLQMKLTESRKQGYILGLSGGLDSAVVAYLTVRAVGPEKIVFLNLPDRDSKDIHIQHAQQIAQSLDIELRTVRITPLLNQMGVYELLPINRIPGQIRESVVKFGKALVGPKKPRDLLEERLNPTPYSWIAKGNAYATVKHRLRMVMIYHQADLQSRMVVGAANRTEWMTGTFSHWGCDHCADVMPILHLYRCQLLPLAEYLKIPGEIRNKAADPDLLPGISDKEALLGSFEICDQILWGLTHGVDIEELHQVYGTEAVNQINRLREHSRPLRETPYSYFSQP